MSRLSSDGSVWLEVSGQQQPPVMPVAFRRTTGAGNGSRRASAKAADKVDNKAGNKPSTEAGKDADNDAARKEALFLPTHYLNPKESYDVAPAARDVAGPGAAAGKARLRARPDDIFVVELSDGGTFVANPARLQEALELVGGRDPEQGKPRLEGPQPGRYPDPAPVPDTDPDTDPAPPADIISLDSLGPDATTRRGAAATLHGMITRVTLLGVMSDGRAVDELHDAILGEVLRDFPGLGNTVSWPGTRALMGAIESRLDFTPGLRRWTHKSNGVDDLSQAAPDEVAPGTPILVFVHGTGSSTLGSFGHLSTTEPDLWKGLRARFGTHIYGFEHYTLSHSPIDNARDLARALPKGAQVSLVSHSRGGLVADLLCLQDFRAHIPDYTYQFERVGTADDARDRALRDNLREAHAGQQRTLEELARLLLQREFRIRRYVRIASPANGTLLASGNFDIFLSSLLNLLQAVPFLYSSSRYWGFSRAVIEVAKRGIDPHMIPGIEAMLPDSPLAQLLCQAPVQESIEMAVIAGDSDGGNMLSRLRVALTDFVLFDKEDNDLVVDTPAMLAGVAPRLKAHVLFEHGSHVSHFRYFSSSASRHALRDWLLADDPARVQRFIALPGPDERVSAAMPGKDRRGQNDEPLPVVVVLPDLMGSHLEAGDERLWFPLKNSAGALAQLGMGAPGVRATELFDILYGKLCERLAASHNVYPFPYDWRQPLDKLGAELAGFLEQFRNAPQPVRLLAHGMGGLLVRACDRVTRPERSAVRVPGAPAPILEQLMAREGSRLIMLGTPNHGTYSLVADLLGKGDGFRSLWRLDAKGPPFGDLRALFATFPGFLSLLPAPDFIDVSQAPSAAMPAAAAAGAGRARPGKQRDYFSRDTWLALKDQVADRWFKEPCIVPDSGALDAAGWLFRQDVPTRAAAALLPEAAEPKTVYVFGVAPSTPCGIDPFPGSEPPRIGMLATPLGDGVVTWESGRLTGIDSYYFMPSRHGDLASTTEYFPALLELLKTGATLLLPREAPARPNLRAGPVRYDTAPPTATDTEAVQRCLLGGSVRRRLPSGLRRRLGVAVRAMDLRFVTKPIMVGHYEQDTIAGPEALIDRELLGGDLGKRYNLGQYAGARGSATVVLRGALAAERHPRLSGAVVTGLGHYNGSLSASELTESVRVGALRFLLQVVDVLGKDARELDLATLLLGFNSAANLTAASSVEALVRGVVLANARFYETTGLDIRIARLEIVEMYLDTAVGAAYALHELDSRLSYFAREHETELEVAKELVSGEGARQRFRDTEDASYWPRIIVTDADREDGVRAPAFPSAGGARRGAVRIADRLRFMFVGARARAETTVQQRQPNLIEILVRQQIASHRWDAQFGRMLFQLMVPHDFKEALRQHDRLVLVLDDYTANLPWELMLADGAPSAPDGAERRQKPLAVRTSVVRQLATMRYRPQVVQAAVNSALVIGNPSVRGFIDAFPQVAPAEAPGPLPGAYEEARAIVEVLHKHGYHVGSLLGRPSDAVVRTQTATASAAPSRRVRPGGDGREDDPTSASKVLAALYRQPWRILHIGGHGVFQIEHGDGHQRSGVLLSDGLLITPSEIAAMEVVPELVFLNCCHQGQIDGGDSNRLAASVASELIEIGVRCVLVAGWAVDDSLAKDFGIFFYNALLGERKGFGDAVFLARNKLWDNLQRDERHDPDLTWGAFQAYGDPGWMAETAPDDGNGPLDPKPFVALEELLDALTDVRVRLAHQRDRFSELDGMTMLNRVDHLVHKCGQPKWGARAELHSAIGATMRELNEVRRAYQAFLCTVQLDDPSGRVPVHDIEQLADVEAEYGEQCCERALNPHNGDAIDIPSFDKGRTLIDQALQRLYHLDQLASLGADMLEPESESDTSTGQRLPCPLSTAPNCLRQALRGRVCRRMASVHARRVLSLPQKADGISPGDDAERRKARDSIHHYLDLAIEAYAGAEGSPAMGYFFPDLTLNRLALDALGGAYVQEGDDETEQKRKREPAVTLARLCGQGVDGDDDGGGGITLLRAKSMLVEELIGGGFGSDNPAASDAIAKAYLDATANITLKPSELDGIVTDLESLSRLFRALAEVEEELPVREKIAIRLMELARQLRPRRTFLAERRSPAGLALVDRSDSARRQ